MFIRHKAPVVSADTKNRPPLNTNVKDGLLVGLPGQPRVNKYIGDALESVLSPNVLSSIVMDYYGPHADPRLQYVKQLGSKPLSWSRLKQLDVGTTVWIAPVARTFRRNVLAEQAVLFLSDNNPTEDAYLQFRIVEPRNGRYYQKHSRPAPDGHGLILSLSEHSWFQPRVFECTQVGDTGKPLAHADLFRVPPMTHLLVSNPELDRRKRRYSFLGVLIAAKRVPGDIEVTIQWPGLSGNFLGNTLLHLDQRARQVHGDPFWLGPNFGGRDCWGPPESRDGEDPDRPKVDEATFRLSKNKQLVFWREPSFSAPALSPTPTTENLLASSDH
jgi:hypothetical protein